MGFSSDGCWQQLHGSFTPSHACGCAAQCCEGVQRGSLIVLPVLHRPQVATPVLRSGVYRSPVTMAPSCGLETASWRIVRLAQHRQIVSVCPMMRRRSLAGIFVKVHPAATGSAETWKGRIKTFPFPGPCRYSKATTME